MTKINIEGYSMKCDYHTYITLFRDDKFIRRYDNNLYDDNPNKDEYYAEHIIAAIEKRTGMKITDIPIIGHIEDFDEMRFLYGGYKKGADWSYSGTYG